MMFDRRRERKVKELLVGPPMPTEIPKKVPLELLASFRARQNTTAVSPARKPRAPQWRRSLWTYAAAMSLALILACQIPTSYDIPVGVRVQADLSTQLWEEHEARLETLDQGLREIEGVESISFNVRIDPKYNKVHIDVQIWGQKDLNDRGVLDSIYTHYPWLRDAKLEISPLEGQYRGTVASRLRHRWGNIDTSTLEQVRHELMQELMQKHPNGDVNVELKVETHGEHQEVRIEAKVRETRDEKD